MREGAKDQLDGEEGTAPRKKWMKKGRLRAALFVCFFGSSGRKAGVVDAVGFFLFFLFVFWWW